MTGRVVVVGSLNVDLVVRVEEHPRPGETVRGGDLQRMPGGKGANQALAAARAGAEVQLVGRVGTDTNGAAYREGLRSRGVGVDHVRATSDRTTGTAAIAVAESGENTIIVSSGANACLDAEDVEAARDVIVAADVLLLQLEVPLDAVVRACEVAGDRTRVVLNPSPVRELPAVLLDAADPLVVNEHEVRRYDGVEVCVTLGPRGARWRGLTVEPPVVESVDTTGAGDAFAGALAAALAAGADERESLRAAVQAGARATTWQGAQDWVLD